MLTRGFKLYAGFGLASIVMAVVYGIASGFESGRDYLQVIDISALEGVFSLGWRGNVGEHSGYVMFFFVGLASFLFAGILAAFRDADPKSVSEISDDGTLPAAQSPTAPSYWPVIGAFGLGVTIIGIATSAAIMGIGLVIVAVAVAEWGISAWTDRLTANAEVNRTIRNRLLWPVEVPVVGALGVAVVAIGLWRVFVAVSQFSAVWVASGAAALVFFVAVAFAASPKVGKQAVVSVVAVIAVAVIVSGIVATAVGSRDFHEVHHEDSTAETDSMEQGTMGEHDSTAETDSTSGADHG